MGEAGRREGRQSGEARRSGSHALLLRLLLPALQQLELLLQLLQAPLLGHQQPLPTSPRPLASSHCAGAGHAALRAAVAALLGIHPAVPAGGGQRAGNGGAGNALHPPEPAPQHPGKQRTGLAGPCQTLQPCGRSLCHHACKQPAASSSKPLPPSRSLSDHALLPACMQGWLADTASDAACLPLSCRIAPSLFSL